MTKKNKRQLGFQSALLVTYGVIIGAIFLAVFFWWMGAESVAMLLMAISAAGLIGRFWGLSSLRNVEGEIEAERGTLSVGQTVKIHYKIRNNKALPLMWLELCQDIPYKDCLEPEGDFIRRAFLEDEASHIGRSEAYMRRFAFLGSFETLEWNTEWMGKHRGVTMPGNLVFRSGDGFGLTQIIEKSDNLTGQTLVVWPEIYKVNTDYFLRNVWSGKSGSVGYTEDPTVLRGERRYEPMDPWKRIDWRVAARTDELMVRQYDTVSPQGILFILDLASFTYRETVISILASVIRDLCSKGIGCGLALPKAGNKEPLLHMPEEGDDGLYTSMYDLATLDAENISSHFDRERILSVRDNVGQIFLVTKSGKDTTCPMLAEQLSGTGLRLFSINREGSGFAAQTITFSQVWEGGSVE